LIFSPSPFFGSGDRDDLAKFLVENGADAAAKDKRGSTLLHLVSKRGSEDLALFLLKHGVDVTCQNDDGFTPLHLASKRGSVYLARLLVEHGADVTVNLKSKDGSTPLHMAVRVREIELFERDQLVNLARVLIKHGADVTALDKSGSTPLDEAKRVGRTDLVSFLSSVEHGADATIQEGQGAVIPQF
jgi:ankyrin repeat protein